MEMWSFLQHSLVVNLTFIVDVDLKINDLLTSNFEITITTLTFFETESQKQDK